MSPPPNGKGGGRRWFRPTAWRCACRAGTALVGIALAVLLVRSGVRAHANNRALGARYAAFDAECRRLEGKRADLAAETFALDNDPFYIEWRMRSDGRLAREGELILERVR